MVPQGRTIPLFPNAPAPLRQGEAAPLNRHQRRRLEALARQGGRRAA
jgi:hypothetical protein